MLNMQAIRVLDLTDLAGQFAGKVLADLGLEVIKVEPPGGDPVRRLPPFKDEVPDPDASLPFLYLNASKKSITLNLDSPEGQRMLKDLARGADILLESFPPGRMEQWGIGYDALALENPGLVMVSITGFGQDGPRAAYLSSDLVALAMSGLLNMFGEPARPPCKPPETQAYYQASAYAALAALFALRHRNATGRGQHVDVSLQESLAVIDQIISSAANEKFVMRREGAQHKQVSPANVFACRDGYVYLFVSAGGGHWKQFLTLWTDHPPALDAPQWESPGFRRQNTATINEAVRQFTMRFRRDNFVEHMQSNGIPCLPVNSPREFLEDPQTRARGFVQSVNHPRWGVYRHPGAPYLLDGQKLPIRPAPSVGEHNAEIHGNGRADSNQWQPRESGERTGCGALAGIRVLAFTQALAGPWAGLLLASHGAEVIKVESSLAADAFRRFGARHAPPRFLEYNRNTLSISVNLKHPQGPELIKRLAKQCDAVIENFSAPVMGKFGLDFPDLRAVKKDIIMLRMPGFGTAGPKREWQSWGQTLNAYAGLLHLWRHDEQSEPAGSQTPLADYMGGVIGLCALMAALLDRDRTGEGHLIDLSQAEALGYFAGVTYLQTLFGRDPAPEGNRSTSAAPHDCFPCLAKGEDDRWCAIAVETEDQWKALCGVMGQADLTADPRFATFHLRQEHLDELNKEIAQWTSSRDPYDVMEQLQAAGVPCGVVQTGDDLLRDPHLRARRFLIELKHPAVGPLVYPGSPFRMLGTPGQPDRLAPELGEHNEHVFGRLLGMTREEIEKLQEDKVLI